MNTAKSKYLDGEYQRAVGDLVGREVYYCVSTLVSELSGSDLSATAWETFPEYNDDLFNAYRGMPDYEEAARDNGLVQIKDDSGATVWTTTSGCPEQTYDSAMEACDEYGIEPYEREVFEHWLVSDWLAEKLEEKNERVLKDFFGLTVWCRTTSGQSILLDQVICDIYDAVQAGWINGD
jgi:hypothetical protein